MIIKIKNHNKKKFEKEINLGSNAVEILRFLIKYKNKKFTSKTIAKTIDMDLSIVRGNLVILQKEGLVKKEILDNNYFYSFILQERIIFKTIF